MRRISRRALAASGKRLWSAGHAAGPDAITRSPSRTSLIVPISAPHSRPIDHGDVGGILAPGDLALVDPLEVRTVQIAVRDLQLDAVVPRLARHGLPLHDLSGHRGAIHEREPHHVPGPEEAEPVVENESDQSGHQEERKGQGPAGQPDEGFAAAPDTLHRCPHRYRYLFRSLSRTSSAAVLTTNVRQKSRKAARNSTRNSVPPSGASGSSTAMFADKRPEAVEDAPVHDRRIARGHEHDHGLADRPPEADHDGGKDTRTARGQDDAERRLPAVRPERQGSRSEVLGDIGEGVLGNGEDDGDHREAHGHPDHERVALVIRETEGRRAASHGSCRPGAGSRRGRPGRRPARPPAPRRGRARTPPCPA